MKCIHAVISGEVQGVGYREKVKRLAFELNICGRVMNLED
jgi:acylphosphatase